MRRNSIKKIAAVSVALVLSAAMLFAADSAALYQKFSDAVAAGDVKEAIDIYTELSETAGKEYTKAQRSYEKALDAGNMAKAREAWNDMRSITSYPMTEEESDALLSQAAASLDQYASYKPRGEEFVRFVQSLG